MDDDLALKLRRLRLYGVVTHWDEYVKLAGKRRMSPIALLKHVVEEEYKVLWQAVPAQPAPPQTRADP